MKSLSVPKADKFERKKAPDCSICATRVPAKSSVICSRARATVAVVWIRSNWVAAASYSAVAVRGRSAVRHATSAGVANNSIAIAKSDRGPSAIHRSLFHAIMWRIIPKNKKTVPSALRRFRESGSAGDLPPGSAGFDSRTSTSLALCATSRSVFPKGEVHTALSRWS